jgi:hypothetical protein
MSAIAGMLGLGSAKPPAQLGKMGKSAKDRAVGVLPEGVMMGHWIGFNATLANGWYGRRHQGVHGEADGLCCLVEKSDQRIVLLPLYTSMVTADVLPLDSLPLVLSQEAFVTAQAVSLHKETTVNLVTMVLGRNCKPQSLTQLERFEGNKALGFNLQVPSQSWDAFKIV